MLFWSSFGGCVQSTHTHYVGMIPVESKTMTEFYRITKRSSSGGITDHLSRNTQPSQFRQAEGDYAAMWPSRRKEEIYCAPNHFRRSDHSFERQSLKERRWRRVETSLLDIKQTLNRHDERWENLEKQVAAYEKKRPESDANSIVERTSSHAPDKIRHSKDYEAVMKEMTILKEDMKKAILELRSKSNDDEHRIKDGMKAEGQEISDILNVINDLEEKIANSRRHHEEGLEQLRIKINQMEMKHDDIFNKLSRIESKLDEIQAIDRKQSLFMPPPGSVHFTARDSRDRASMPLLVRENQEAATISRSISPPSSQNSSSLMVEPLLVDQRRLSQPAIFIHQTPPKTHVTTQEIIVHPYEESLNL